MKYKVLCEEISKFQENQRNQRNTELGHVVESTIGLSKVEIIFLDHVAKIQDHQSSNIFIKC